MKGESVLSSARSVSGLGQNWLVPVAVLLFVMIGVAPAASITYMAYSSMLFMLNNSLEIAYNNSLPVDRLYQAQAALLRIHGHLLSYAILPDERSSHASYIRAEVDSVDQLLKMVEDFGLDTDQRLELQVFTEHWRAFQQITDTVLAQVDAKDLPAAQQSLAINGPLDTSITALTHSLDRLINAKHAESSDLDRANRQAFTQTILVSVFLVGIQLVVVLGVVVSGSVFWRRNRQTDATKTGGRSQ